MIEEDVLGVGGVCGDITITRLGFIQVFGLLPLDRWAGRRARCSVAFGALHPTFGYRVVAQISNIVVIIAPRVIGICRGSFHCWHSGRRAKRLIILLALLLYLHHAGGIIFLAYRNVVAADAVNIAELAYAEFACYTFVADEVMLGKAVLRHSDDRGRIDGVILCFVEGDSLWGTIDIHALKVAVALDDTLAGGIVSVTDGLTVIRQYHQSVILIPIHSPFGV